MGSVWRALAFGFAGLRPIGDALAIDPVLAPGWEALDLRVRFRRSRVHLRIEPNGEGERRSAGERNRRGEPEDPAEPRSADGPGRLD